MSQIEKATTYANTTKTLCRYTRFTILLCAALPIIIISWSKNDLGGKLTSSYFGQLAATGALSLGLGLILYLLLRHLEPGIDRHSQHEATFLDELPIKWVPLAIVLSAAGSLCLELAIIRWQGTVWEVFAFYKNFSLLACFAGLGLGYALAHKNRIPATLILPLLALQVSFLIALRHGLGAEKIRLIVTPIKEQLNMGFPTAASPSRLVATYCFLAVTMFLTALLFIPLGQICGRLLNRTSPLKAYGLNLLGSIAGVLLSLLLSFLWTPPVIWLIPSLLIVILLQSYSTRALILACSSALLVVSAISWPVSFGYEKIYSPYQLLERTGAPGNYMVVRAAGHYFQRMLDLSPKNTATIPSLQFIARYYELPYHLHPHSKRIAIVGSGTGNDVAAALRMGVERVDAIEIDPVIIKLGQAFHPESPYDSRKVAIINKDARQFLRTTNQHYDMIIYGLLDSHTLLSHTSSVRLDSFVYTVEGIRDAWDHLNEDGVISLSFCILSKEIGRKIYLMMQQAFDGIPPICIRTRYDGSVLFAQSKRGKLKLDPAILSGTIFTECTNVFANPMIRADVSTDDWPFFYMPKRVYPISYVWMIILILSISTILYISFIGERPRVSLAPFFFMGCGFMLIETKAITELGLVFGNTWQVIGIVIAAILTMAFLANVVVLKLRIQRPLAAFSLVIMSLGIGLAIARMGGYNSTIAGQFFATFMLTLPMLFAGVAFSSLIASTKSISSALAINLFGSLCGGLFEYNSMYFGFGFLYWIAIAFYLLAMTYYWLQSKK